ncbi:hypothetical protein Tco_0242578 [Tanacetum coccineum]
MEYKNRQSVFVSKRIERSGKLNNKKRAMWFKNRQSVGRIKEAREVCMLATHMLKEENYGGSWEFKGISLMGILSYGFHFTWTKSRGNPKCKTLKNLDRIMINEAFMEKFLAFHGIFLPYLISDYSPAVLKLPNGMMKNRKAFRFSNFMTDKKEFLPNVKEA